MRDFRIGYLYSFAPIHCGGEGDLGNILEVVREAHTNFPYVPGSSLRGSLRNEVALQDLGAADALFGKELNGDEPMGVHQVWFGDARLLWVPMRTMSNPQGKDAFTWVSCHSLIRDHALLAKLPTVAFNPNIPVGIIPGTYTVADAQVQVSVLSEQQRQALDLAGDWTDSLQDAVKPTWERNRLVLPDTDFQVLMEHSLWTQIRNKIKTIKDKDNPEQDDSEQEGVGSAEIFWTDVCIPRDTILYYPWGYSLSSTNPIAFEQHELLVNTLQGLLQVGGQANVGRGWVQSWITDATSPVPESQEATTATE